MARAKKNSPAAAEAVKSDVVVASGVQPVVAVHRILFGAKKVVPSKTLFTPNSEAERADLLARKAVREPTDVELLAAGAVAASIQESVQVEPVVEPVDETEAEVEAEVEAESAGGDQELG